MYVYVREEILTLYILGFDGNAFTSVLIFLLLLFIEIMFCVTFEEGGDLFDSCEDPSNTVGCLLELEAY